MTGRLALPVEPPIPEGVILDALDSGPSNEHEPEAGMTNPAHQPGVPNYRSGDFHGRRGANPDEPFNAG